MPGGDGTGPYCDPNWYCRRIYGRGAAFRGGFGRGRGRYWQRFPVAAVTLTKEEQQKLLEAELKEIEAEKQGVEKKLKELID